jgi:hypothetical protein
VVFAFNQGGVLSAQIIAMWHSLVGWVQYLVHTERQVEPKGVGLRDYWITDVLCNLLPMTILCAT